MNAKTDSASLAKQFAMRSGRAVLVDPADIPEQNLPGGDLRIPVDKLTTPLRYLVPQPVTEYERDRLNVFLRLKGDVTKIPLVSNQALGPVADRVWPMPFDIPVVRLVENSTPETPTEWELVYQLIANGANPGPEVITDFKIDKTKPYQTKTPPTDFSPPAMAFPADLPPNKDIDDSYLGANPTGITVTVQLAGSNAEATDICDVYWGIASEPEYATPVLTGVVVPSDGKIVMPVSIFENSKEGLNTLTFTVKDLAGNISRRSKPDQRNVRRLAAPVPLKPIIPLADGTDGDTLIDLADCDRGVTVEVPVPLPSAPSDTINVWWAGIELGELPVGANTTLVFKVDYVDVIKVAYGNTDGSVPTTVNYAMFRGSGGPIAEESTVINVDISYPGPVNPDEPSDINPDLNLPRLVSSQGVDNELDDNDYEKDADIFIKLYAVPATEAAQSIAVFYDDVELLPHYLLRPGEEDTEIKAAVVPWAVIARKPNEDVKIKWRLSAVGNNNSVYSKEETVVVDITKIVLPPVEVQALVYDSISCPTLNFLPATDPDYPGDGTSRRNLKVVIPFSDSMQDGRDLILKWEGFEDEGATIPIADTAITKTIPMTDPIPPDGYATDIGEYFEHFKPVSDGFGKLSYTITDVVPESDPAIHFVFLLDNDDDYCEIANPIPAP
jgi:hypothetical protein